MDGASPWGGSPRTRTRAQELLARHADTAEPAAWLEPYYAEAKRDPTEIRWARLAPNATLVRALDALPRDRVTGRALVVGSALGDDAEELARRGFATTAFDVSPSAITWCRERFFESVVTYTVADLLDPPSAWRGAFDLVWEALTVQVMPEALHAAAIARIAEFLAPGGILWVFATGRDASEPHTPPPWRLTEAEVRAFGDHGLELDRLEEFTEPRHHSTEITRRFLATFHRPIK